MAEEKKNKKRFFKDFKAELKKIIWPTPKQLLTGTVAVVTIVIATTIIIFALDLVFEGFNNYGIKPIKEKVQSNSIIEQNTEGQESDAEDTNTENSNAADTNTEESNNE